VLFLFAFKSSRRITFKKSAPQKNFPHRMPSQNNLQLPQKNPDPAIVRLKASTHLLPTKYLQTIKKKMCPSDPSRMSTSFFQSPNTKPLFKDSVQSF